MKKILFPMILVLSIALPDYPQSVIEFLQEGKKLVHEGTVTFDDYKLIQARGLFERAFDADEESYFAQYYLAYTDYRLAIYYMQNKNISQFKSYNKSATNELKSLLDKDENNAEVISLLASVYGIQISVDPGLGPTLGSQNVALTSQALGIAPNNPRVLLQAGISKLNTPEFFGGSKTKALEYFKKSVKAFETSGESIANIEWGYLDALAWLGTTYTQLNDFTSAIETYNKALEVAPNFSWVKNNLLPTAEDKLSNSNE
jgi:tetratricopeptide (TPR) repeat protein